MSNIPWPHRESSGQRITVGYVENSDMNGNLRELSRQYKEMLAVSMDLQRSNQEMEKVLKNKEKGCSCRETVIKKLSETLIAVRKLDERCKVGEHDILTLTEEVSNLNQKIDIVYAKASTNQDYLSVAKRPQPLFKQTPLDTSGMETAVDEFSDTVLSTENDHERTLSDVVNTGKTENEVSDAMKKEYYDLTQKGKGTADIFGDLYNEFVSCDSPSSKTANDKQQTERICTNDLAQDNIKRIPRTTKTDDCHGIDKNNFDECDVLHEHESNVPDWHSTAHNTVIKAKGHSERTVQVDFLEQDTSHKQDSCVSRQGTGYSNGPVDENIPVDSHSKQNVSETTMTRDIKRPVRRKGLKRIFTDTSADNRTTCQRQGRSAPSVAAGEYLYYPAPEESNIKVKITPHPNIEWSGGRSGLSSHQVPLSSDKSHQENTSSSMPHQEAQGPSTVLCLDVSENMRGRAFQQMIATAKTIITGVQAIAHGTHSKIEETFAIATFGHETRIVVHMTNDYNRLLSTLDTLAIGGTSNIKNGLMVCLTAFSGNIPTEKDIQAKIVVISDGRYETQGTVSAGEQQTLFCYVNLWSILHELTQRAIRVFCVPVGEARLDTFEKICNTTKGKVIQQSHTHQIIKMSQAVCVAVELASNFEDMTQSSKKSIIRELGYATSEEDLENILEQLDFVESHIKNDDGYSKYKFEEFDPNLPEIGTRVRRGPDWNWENQDSEGPGTVIGHNVKGMVWVEWDNGTSNRYHYKKIQYDVVVVEEPRELFNELIAVGCVVKRGVSWVYGDQDGGPSSKGVVIRVVRDGTVLVRWQNKKKYTYKFGCDGVFEVDICEPYELVSRPPSGSNDNVRGDGSKMHKVSATDIKSNDVTRSRHESNRHSTYINGNGAVKLHESQKYPQPKDRTTERSNESLTETVAIWQYYHQNGNVWCEFPPDLQEKIEKAYSSNAETTLVTMDSERYKITFSSMTYNNIYTNVKTKLPLRRNE